MLTRSLALYGVLDVLFSALYACFVLLGPGRGAWLTAVVLVLSLLLCGSGVGLLLRARWSRVLGLVSCLSLLALAFLLIALLVASAAYLRGVFGGFGTGAALVALTAAALVVELVALLPAFQLRFLLRDDVRRLLAP
jgi:hypothetical protein